MGGNTITLFQMQIQEGLPTAVSGASVRPDEVEPIAWAKPVAPSGSSTDSDNISVWLTTLESNWNENVNSISNRTCTFFLWLYLTDIFAFWIASWIGVNSADTEDGIFRLWGSISCLLMHWRLKLPVHQQAWHWLWMTDNMHCCSRDNFIYLDQDKFIHALLMMMS